MTTRILTIVALTLASPVFAQAPQITSVFPPGGALGGHVSVRFEGANLGGASNILIGGRGVKQGMSVQSGSGNAFTSELQIASDAEAGAHELRVVTAKGVSNPAYFWVGATPEANEVEPNNQPAQATKLTNLPVTINGRADAPEDMDWFTFDAQAGDSFVFDCCAARIYSAIDPMLELRDSEGRLLALGTEGYDRDPRIVYTFKKAGAYRLLVRDTLYRGGPSYLYRVTIGKLPVITSLFPPGGKRGAKLEAAVDGVNLSGIKTLALDIPADAPDRRPYYVIPQTPAGPALPIRIAVSDDPQSAAAPGGLATLPNAPATVNGRIESGDRPQTFQFAAAPGQPLEIAVRSRSIGSRLDPFLRILDATGKELLTTEDQAGRDPRITFSPPAAGTYRLEVSTLDNHGGADYYYQILLRSPATPDFHVNVSPDLTTLGKGQTLALNVNAARRGGHNADIVVRVEGAPAGIAASPLTLGPGRSSGVITLTAQPGAALPPPGVLRVVAESTVEGGRKVSRPVTVIASLPRPGEGEPAPRAVEFQAAWLMDAVPLFTLTPEQTEVVLTPGQSISMKVRAPRKPGDNAANPAIGLSIADLPAGVTAELPAIPEKQGEVTIKLTAAGNAPVGQSSAILTGKIGDNATQIAPAIHVVVKPK